MSFTRYNFSNWNNLPAENLNSMQLFVKAVIKDFLGNLLNIGFGRGGWKRITFAQNGPNAVNVSYEQWAFLVQDHMLATPAPGTVQVPGFADTAAGERNDVIGARVYESEDRTKVPYEVTQQVEIKRIENATPDEYGFVYSGGKAYLALCNVRVGTTGIVAITPYPNEPRIDTRNVDGTELRNGNRENLYDALKRLENMINALNVGGDQDGGSGEPVDLSPYVKKASFGMLTGTMPASGTNKIEWNLTGLFPNHTPVVIACEVNQLVTSAETANVQRKIYKPHKDWFSSSTVETWEALGKGAEDDPQGEKCIFKLNGPSNGQGVYVRIFLLHEDGVYVRSSTSSVPVNLRHVSVT